MEEYGSCLVTAKDGEIEALKSLLVENEEVESVYGADRTDQPHLIYVKFRRRLDLQGIEMALSPFRDKIEKWQPNYRMRPLAG